MMIKSSTRFGVILAGSLIVVVFGCIWTVSRFSAVPTELSTQFPWKDETSAGIKGKSQGQQVATSALEHFAKATTTALAAGGGFAMRAWAFDSDCVRGPGADVLGCRPDKVPDDEHYNFDRKQHPTTLVTQGDTKVGEVNFANEGAMAKELPDLEGDKDIVLVFYGRVHIEAWDTYKFCTTSKDGARVFVDGAILVDFDGKHGASQKCSTRNLMPGLHDVRMDSFQLGDGPAKLTYSSKKVVAGEKPVPSVNDLGPQENWDANTGYSIRVWVNFPPLAPLLSMPAIYDETPFAHGKLKESKVKGLQGIVKDAMLPKVGGVAWDVAGVVRTELEGKYSFCGASVSGMQLYISNHVMIDKTGPAPVVDCGEVHLLPGAYQVYAKGFSPMAASAMMKLTYFGPDTNNSPKPIPSVNHAILPAPKNGFRVFLFEKMPGKGTPTAMAWARPDWQQICNPLDKKQRKELSPPPGCQSVMVPDPTQGVPPPPVYCCFTPPVDKKGKPGFEFLIDTIAFYTPLDFVLRAVGFKAKGFAYHIYGSVYVDKGGTKNLCVTCTDGCRLWFDDLLKPKFISDNLKFAPVQMCKPVSLSEGVHPFLMDGFQNIGLAMAVVTMDGKPIRSVDAQLPEDWKAQVSLKAREPWGQTLHVDDEPNEETVEVAEEEAQHVRTPAEESVFEEVLGILDLHESTGHGAHTQPKHATSTTSGGLEEDEVRHGQHETSTAANTGEEHAVRHEAGGATKRSLESTMAGLRETREELGKLMHNNVMLSHLKTIRPMSAKERRVEQEQLRRLSAPAMEKELVRRLRATEQRQLAKVEQRRSKEDARWKKQEEKDLGIGRGGPWGLDTWKRPKPLPRDRTHADGASKSERGGGKLSERQEDDEEKPRKNGRRLLYTTQNSGGKRDSNGEIHPGFRYPTHKHPVDTNWGSYDLPSDAFGQPPHTAKELWKPLSGSWEGGSWKDHPTYDDKGYPYEVPSFYDDGVRQGGKAGEWHDGWMDYWHDFHDDERKVAADGDAWRLVHRDLTTPYITDWVQQFDPNHPDYMRITHSHGPHQYGRWGKRDYSVEHFPDNCCGESRLRAGAYLRSEVQLNYMQSYADMYRLTLQEHGDLTLFYMGPADKRANGRGGGWTVWSSQTMYKGTPPYRLQMQWDCDLVLFDKDKTKLWSSGSAGKNQPGTYCSLILHEDGVVTVQDTLGSVAWRQAPDKDPYYWVTRYKNKPNLKIPMTSSA